MNHIINKAPVLYQFVHLLQTKELNDKATIDKARKVVADTIGTAFGGSRTKAFQYAIKTNDTLFGEGDFPVWGTNHKTTLQGSIFFNSLAVSLTDFDEGHRKAAGHPANLVVPVSMMLGKQLNKSFTEILKAIIKGYEAGVRFSYARVPAKVETWSTGRWGGIASAAASAYLLELNEIELMHALSLAYILSPGMQGGSTDVSTGAMSKEGVAWAAQSGLQAALLAKNGFTGPYLFIDNYDEINTDRLLSDEKNPWLIQSNYFKPYACCRWLHTAISLASKLKNEHHIGIDDIDKIEVAIFERAHQLIDTNYPQNIVQAQFHLPFTIAAILLFHEITPEITTDEVLAEPKIKSLVNKVVLKADKRFDQNFPVKLGSAVNIYSKKGHTYSDESFEAPWDASTPPTNEELYQKFEKQVGSEAKSLWNKIFNDE